MYRKSLSSGLLIGILLVLAMSFVVYNQLTGLLPGWRWMDVPWIPRDLLRSFSQNASAFLLLFVGTLAALRARPASLKEGIQVGALSGLVAAWVVETCLIAPYNIIRLGGASYVVILAAPPGEAMLQETLRGTIGEVFRTSMVSAIVVPLLGLLLGAGEGFVVALIRRAGGRPAAAGPSGPDLLDVVRRPRLPRLQDPHDRPLRAGLAGGAIGGFLLSAEVFILAVPALLSNGGGALLQQGVLPIRLTTLAEALLIPAAVLVPLTILLWGGFGVLLLAHPPDRFASRLRASLACGAAGGGVFTLLTVVPVANMLLLVAPLAISGNTGTPLTAYAVEAFGRFLSLGYPLIPIAVVLATTVLGLVTGLPWVLLSALLWPRRPVDRAATLARRLRRHPETLLPSIYALFQRDDQAVQVLEHTMPRLHGGRDQTAALVVAAYHTLCRNPGRAAEALGVIVEATAANPGWRWQSEIGELHRFLREGLQARNFYHMAAIRPLPEERTSSLPQVLSQVGERLSRAVGELKKAQRIDDPNGRSIYLNRALEEVNAAEQYVGESSGGSKASEATLYPEQRVLQTLLPHWRGALLESLRDLRGRALLQAELETRQFNFLPRLVLRLRIANTGLNIAEQVRITLEPGGGYQLLPESEARIELLPPGEQRVVDLALEPRAPRPIRVLFHIYYNDAVDANRELTLADEIVFAAAERPFQRIFPIPYVTGTPIKTQEMFFGRQDVFSYIREHLLGTYQNNIIVLHGQRRTGKTSVLYRLGEVLQDTHYCVLLDMQGIAARNEAEFFYTLSDEIAYTLEKAGLEVALPPRQEYEAQPEFTFRSRFLRGLYPALGEKHLLLMFDEFEELQRHVEDGHIGAGIFPFLRNIMQHEQPVDFIFSGTHKLEDLAAEYWSILFNIATYKQISFLERQEVERLITEPVAPFGMEYDPLAVQRIYEVTAGHPFLTQLVCHEMVAYHNETERSYISVADVDTVLERIAERGEAHFKYVWAGADGPERLTMLAMAELLAHAEAATAAEVAALTQNRKQSIDAETALRALVRLESRDIVTRTAPGSERFHFRVDLVRRWVARNPQLVDTVNQEPK